MFTNDAMSFIFFFNDTATTEIYTLSLHDALPISGALYAAALIIKLVVPEADLHLIIFIFALLCASYTIPGGLSSDRKSTRLNSSHANISYAVFCLKKNRTTSTTSRSTT